MGLGLRLGVGVRVRVKLWMAWVRLGFVLDY